MPILNYTTKIDVRKTAGEISGILAEFGALAVNIEYENKQPVALSFRAAIDGKFIDFRLPSRWQGVYKLLEKDAKVPRTYRTEEQARRVAWRIVKDWVEAQMAVIDAGAAELAEVFLPYAIHPDTGRTLFQEFKSGGLLPSGEVVEGEVVE